MTESFDIKLAAVEQHRTQRSIGEAPPAAIKSWAIDAGHLWGLGLAEQFRALTFDECAALISASGDWGLEGLR